MRITYWVARCRTDRDAYTIRGKIRQIVEEELKTRNIEDYDLPRMVTTPEFAGAFDMLEQCLGEGGPWWEEEREEQEQTNVG